MSELSSMILLVLAEARLDKSTYTNLPIPKMPVDLTDPLRMITPHQIEDTRLLQEHMEGWRGKVVDSPRIAVLMSEVVKSETTQKRLEFSLIVSVME